MGHPAKELLEGEWVRSSYGYPPIILETPKVLVRQEIKLPPEAQANIKEFQMFAYRSSIGLFTMATSSLTLANPEQEPDFEQAKEAIILEFEQKGAKNIITKQEEFKTVSGVTGLKIYGSGKFSVPESKELVRGKYTIIMFGGKGFQQQVILSWLEDDTYAQEIADRILATLEVKTDV